MFLRPASAQSVASLLVIALCVSCLAQAAAITPAVPLTATQPVDLDLIVSLRANGVPLGEFVLHRTAAGDFWILAQDFPRLKLEPIEQARRQAGGEAFFSFAALGAQGIVFNETQLLVEVDFPVQSLTQTRIDLSNRPAPVALQPPRNSAILNYRAAVRQAGDDPARSRLTSDLNVRHGELLVRQEAKYDSGSAAPGPIRGTSQLIWDDRNAGNRFIAGDVVVSGGSFGTTFTGAGLSFSKLYSITPDVIRQPGPPLRLSTLVPADVEVAVDGNTIYRTRVGPGPITLENLYYNGGARTVKVTVTDATGRRQVIEQPFLFTDAVLAKGLHEFSYFAGKRSELTVDERWRYGQNAWQAFHRYGATDYVTVEAGAEGTADFGSGGFGATLRDDVFGILALDLLGSIDRDTSTRAKGWSARYTYLTPNTSWFIGRRQYGDAFRTLASTPENAAVLTETRLSASTRIFSAATLSADLVRGRDTSGERSSYAVRFSTNLGQRTSLQAEVQSTRIRTERDWGLNVYLRLDLDAQQWVNSTFRSGPNGRGVDLETGKQLTQGEGVGYRLGVTSDRQGGEQSAFTFGSATWNLRPVTLEFNGASQLKGGRSNYGEGAVSGSVVAVDGYIGVTRQVGDGFALARLGVAQPGVDIFLNNQLQGRTDAAGNLLIPQVGAYGRQDVSLDDKQLPMQYDIAAKRVTITPAYRSGTIVNFGGRKLRALTGSAWLIEGAMRKAIVSRSWPLVGESGRLVIETAPAGDFYLEDAAPGRYSGNININGREFACRATVPDFAEAVHQLKEGVLCE